MMYLFLMVAGRTRYEAKLQWDVACSNAAAQDELRNSVPATANAWSPQPHFETRVLSAKPGGLDRVII